MTISLCSRKQNKRQSVLLTELWNVELQNRRSLLVLLFLITTLFLITFGSLRFTRSFDTLYRIISLARNSAGSKSISAFGQTLDPTEVRHRRRLSRRSNLTIWDVNKWPSIYIPSSRAVERSSRRKTNKTSRIFHIVFYNFSLIT